MSDETVEISSVELSHLRDEAEILNALYIMGVESWEGYEEAMKLAKNKN